jgi:hypothetical protein
MEAKEDAQNRDLPTSEADRAELKWTSAIK